LATNVLQQTFIDVTRYNYNVAKLVATSLFATIS
jgi:hypothetical protein